MRYAVSLNEGKVNRVVAECSTIPGDPEFFAECGESAFNDRDEATFVLDAVTSEDAARKAMMQRLKEIEGFIEDGDDTESCVTFDDEITSLQKALGK